MLFGSRRSRLSRASEPSKSRETAEFRVDPYKNDFYKRVIELRQRVKADLKEAKKLDPLSQEAKSLDMNQLALKILANATSYGIFIELNVEDADDEDALVSDLHVRQADRRDVEARAARPVLSSVARHPDHRRGAADAGADRAARYSSKGWTGRSATPTAWPSPTPRTYHSKSSPDGSKTSAAGLRL